MMKKLLVPFFALIYLLAKATLVLTIYPIDWFHQLFS